MMRFYKKKKKILKENGKDNMNNKQALFVIWNAILNQSQNSEKTLKNTFFLMKRLGLLNDFDECFDRLNYDIISDIMKRKPLIHRFYNKMTYNLCFSVEHIKNDFSKKPCNVFDTISKEKIIDNLLSFRGIGTHKAEVAYEIVYLYSIHKKNVTEYADRVFQSCPALYYTLNLEFQILEYL